MDAGDQHLLVPGPVVDADHAAGGQGDGVAPEEIMVQLDRAGGLEAGDVAALGVDAVEDMLDGAVLAGGIHRLEDAEHPPAVLGIELVLQGREALGAFDQQGGAGVLVEVEAGGIAGVMVLQVEALAGVDPVLRKQLAATLQLHGASPFIRPVAPGRRRRGASQNQATVTTCPARVKPSAQE